MTKENQSTKVPPQFSRWTIYRASERETIEKAIGHEDWETDFAGKISHVYIHNDYLYYILLLNDGNFYSIANRVDILTNDFSEVVKMLEYELCGEGELSKQY